MTKEANQATETPYEQFRRSQSDLIASLQIRLKEEVEKTGAELAELDYQIGLRRSSRDNERPNGELVALQAQRDQLTNRQLNVRQELAVEQKRQAILDWYEGYVRGGINHIRNPQDNRDTGAAFWLEKKGPDAFMINNFATESWRDIKPDFHPKAQELLTLHDAIGIDVAAEACKRIFIEMNFLQSELELH